MTTLRELKTGALLHVLVALLIYGPSSNDEIRRATGWSAEAVHDALDVLKREPHELVTAYPNGRWPTWSLTAHAQALFPSLWKVSPLPADSQRGGGSLTNEPHQESILLLGMSPLPADSPEPPVENPVDNPAAATIIDQLTRLGCTPKRAAKAINAALRLGQIPPEISARIAHLAAYLKTQHLRHPGEWAAQFIEAGAALPDLPAATGPADYSGYRPYLTQEDPDHDA